MEESEYVQLVQFLREKFLENGLNEIAEVRNYEIDNAGEKSLPDSRELVLLMLSALDRVLIMGDRSVVEESLISLRQSIDEGDRPDRVLIHFDQDNSALLVGRSEPEELEGVPGTGEARSALAELIRLIDSGSGNC